MTFRRPRRPDATIELTPLIDVVFLLLIFFMVTSTAVRETVLSVLLPEAHGESMRSTDTVLEIVVSDANEVWIDGESLTVVSYSSIQTHLRENELSSADTHVLIRGDGEADHATVVLVLDALGGLGMSNVRILATEPD
ncbi:MAG: biopolymer transporter ExbD [Gammaproteobacteria bacterium]|nr:biopolymer transporter ExbD [Gammaproteobacteria bacterium]